MKLIFVFLLCLVVLASASTKEESKANGNAGISSLTKQQKECIFDIFRDNKAAR